MPKQKTYDFKVGDRVGENTSRYYDDEYGSNPSRGKLRYNEDDGPAYGEVTAVATNGKVFVKWDKEWNYKNSGNHAVDADELVPEEELRAKWSELEKEFNEIEGQVRARLKVAAKEIREANKLAKKTGRQLAEMYDVIYDDLYSALDASGWRTSSFGC